MHTLFDILIPICLLAVVVVLFFGIYALFRGGDFGRSYSNKLMRLRVLMQFIAVRVLAVGETALDPLLEEAQHRLFDLGADLAAPGATGRLREDDVGALEAAID